MGSSLDDLVVDSISLEYVSLSGQGMRRVARLQDQEFVFYVGGKEYHTTKSVAVFLSGRVARLMELDKTMDTISINVDDREDIFNLLLSLADGEILSIEENGLQRKDRIAVFAKLASELENRELVNMVEEICALDEPISLANAIAQLRNRHMLSMSITDEVTFVASHIQEVVFDERNVLEALGAELSWLVLTNPSLSISDEDWLLDQILDCPGAEYRYLVSCVQFDLLSIDGIAKFLDHFSLEDINAQTWAALCKRLRLSVNAARPSKSNDASGNVSTYEYKGDPFDGIIAQLGKSCGGNPHRRRLIRVTASSKQDVNDNHPYKIVDYNWDGWFVTRNAPDSWVKIDFKKSCVNVTGYSIRGNSNNDHNPECWVLEGSHDDIVWTTLDDVRDYHMHYLTHIGVFEIPRKRANPEYFRYIRIRQVDLNSSNEDYLVITNLEIFGSIKSRHDPLSVDDVPPI